MSLIKLTCTATLLICLSSPVLAQTTDTSPEVPKKQSKMDHSKMDHSKMDHSAHDMSDMSDMTSSTLIATDAQLITAKVNGLVCDFCAQALQKVFKKEEGVEGITVDLDAGEVVIILKAGGELGDDRVKKLIRKSGYSLLSIERSGGA